MLLYTEIWKKKAFLSNVPNFFLKIKIWIFPKCCSNALKTHTWYIPLLQIYMRELTFYLGVYLMHNIGVLQFNVKHSLCQMDDMPNAAHYSQYSGNNNALFPVLNEWNFTSQLAALSTEITNQTINFEHLTNIQSACTLDTSRKAALCFPTACLFDGLLHWCAYCWM